MFKDLMKKRQKYNVEIKKFPLAFNAEL